MQGAIYSALFGHVTPPSVTCTSANCTWPANPITFGVTSNCVNVTQSVSKECTFQPAVYDALDNTNCTITTPRGNTLEVYATSMTNYSSMWYQTAINTTYLTAQQSKSYRGLDPEFFTFAIYRNNASTFTGELGGEIIECGFRWTEYHYENASVVANKFTTANSRSVSLAGNGTGSDDTVQVVFNSSDSSRQYILSYGATGIALFLATLFEGGFWTSQGFPPMFVGQYTPGLRIPAAQSFYNADVAALIANMADAMTERIRTGMNSTPVAGLAHEQAVFVYVRWPWLTLPLLLIFGTIILLILSIMNGRQGEIPLWKSSGIALLFHAIRPWNDDYVVNRTKDLERVADETKVQLLLDKGLEFQVIDGAGRNYGKDDRVALL